MYVRWIVRRHKNAEVANVTFHDAYLMESYRNENGDPRQRTVTYLGNIREINGEFPTIERELFLLRATHILGSTPELSPLDQKQAINQLQERVPPLDVEEVMVGFRNTLRWYVQWWAENGMMPSENKLLELIQYARSTEGELQLDE